MSIFDDDIQDLCNFSMTHHDVIRPMTSHMHGIS